MDHDRDGRRFLDGAGGAIVVNVGHGRRAVIEACAAQLETTQYVHGTMFTTERASSGTPTRSRRPADG